jgi:hypothetical protein
MDALLTSYYISYIARKIIKKKNPINYYCLKKKFRTLILWGVLLICFFCHAVKFSESTLKLCIHTVYSTVYRLLVNDSYIPIYYVYYRNSHCLSSFLPILIKYYYGSLNSLWWNVIARETKFQLHSYIANFIYL